MQVVNENRLLGRRSSGTYRSRELRYTPGNEKKGSDEPLFDSFEEESLLDRPREDGGRRLYLDCPDKSVVRRRDGFYDPADRPAAAGNVRIVDEDEISDLGIAFGPDPLLTTV